MLIVRFSEERDSLLGEGGRITRGERGEGGVFPLGEDLGEGGVFPLGEENAARGVFVALEDFGEPRVLGPLGEAEFALRRGGITPRREEGMGNLGDEGFVSGGGDSRS